MIYFGFHINNNYKGVSQMKFNTYPNNIHSLNENVIRRENWFVLFISTTVNSLFIASF